MLHGWILLLQVSLVECVGKGRYREVWRGVTWILLLQVSLVECVGKGRYGEVWRGVTWLDSLTAGVPGGVCG